MGLDFIDINNLRLELNDYLNKYIGQMITSSIEHDMYYHLREIFNRYSLKELEFRINQSTKHSYIISGVRVIDSIVLQYLLI